MARRDDTVTFAGSSFLIFIFLSSLICSRKRRDYLQSASGLGDDCSSLRRHLQAYHRVSHFCRSSLPLSNQSIYRRNMRSGQSQRALYLVMDTGLHTRTGLRVRVSKLLPIGKPAPVTRGCGFGRRSFKKLVIDIFFSVFVVNDNNAATATPSLANVSRGGFSFLSTKEV